MRLRIVQQQRALLMICVGAITSGLVLYHLMRSFPRINILVPTKKPVIRPPPPPPPVVWDIDASVQHPAEVRHVLFLKTHKTASSTLFSILIRFSIARKLNVMFPREDHLLGEKSANISTIVNHPPSPPFFFDILCNHVIFNQEKLRRYLKDDTVYITILRDPLRRVESAYDYYRNTNYHDEYLMRAPNFTYFMSHMDQFEPDNPYISFTNNRMSLDLGLPPQMIRNSSYVNTFVQQVANIFDLVLIAERFDESMILLKRRLRWTMKDIIFAKLNRRDVASLTAIASSVKKKFEEFSQFDVALYGHFYKLFDEIVQKEGIDFQEEVESYRNIMHSIDDFCANFKIYRGLLVEQPGDRRLQQVLTVPAYNWNKPFVFRPKECESIVLADHVLDRRAKYWQAKRITS